MDDHKILPAKETIRRFHERAAALYENPQPGKNHTPRRRRQAAPQRDISEYLVNEPAPTDAYLKGVLQELLALAARSPDSLAALRRRFGLWKSWLAYGLSTIGNFDTSVENYLPCLLSCFMQGSAAPMMGAAIVG